MRPVEPARVIRQASRVRDDQPTVHEIWSDLRATRHRPPWSAADDPERRRVYVSALQQAEELFVAASQVGYASRPLLAFYGLSQAGRAIAAAAHNATGTDWRLRGHGLTVPNLEAALPDIAVCQQGGQSTSFIRLSTMLRSPLLPSTNDVHRVVLNDLWNTLPETRSRPLEVSPAHPALAFTCIDMGESHPLVSGIIKGIPPPVTDSASPRATFDDFMKAYPTAAGYDLVRAGVDTDTPGYFFEDRLIALQMHWSAGAKNPKEWQRQALISRITTRYNGSLYMFPSVGDNDRSLHPLMAWWAILFALSMLARYQPAEWLNAIDVNSSRYAVALENLLTEALISVPGLVSQTIGSI